MDRVRASYLIETPESPARVAEVMAGEQSCGTFARVEGETDALRARARATVESIVELDAAAAPSLPNARLERLGARGPWRRARIELSEVAGPKGKMFDLIRETSKTWDGTTDPVRPFPDLSTL